MIDLTTSRQSMSLISVAAFFASLAFVLSGIAYVVVTASGTSTSQDFATAGNWVLFAGFTGAFGAVAKLASAKTHARNSDAARELYGATVATLLLAIGFLISALHSTGPSTAGEILAAVGFGGWCILFAEKAARQAGVERDHSEAPGYSRLFVAVSASLLLIAVGTGLPTPGFGDVAPGVAGQVLTAIGLVGITLVLVAARSRTLLRTAQTVNLGLVVLALGFLAYGILAAIVLTSTSGSLTTFRLGLSLPMFVISVGFGVLGLSALRRIYEIAPAPMSVPGSATGILNA
jgi:hypothetical protein